MPKEQIESTEQLDAEPAVTTPTYMYFEDVKSIRLNCISKIRSLERAHRSSKATYYWSFLASGILNTTSTILAGANSFSDSKTFAMPIFLLSGAATLLTALLALTDAAVFKEYLLYKRKFTSILTLLPSDDRKVPTEYLNTLRDKFNRADNDALKVYATVFYKEIH